MTHTDRCQRVLCICRLDIQNISMYICQKMADQRQRCCDRNELAHPISPKVYQAVEDALSVGQASMSLSSTSPQQNQRTSISPPVLDLPSPLFNHNNHKLPLLNDQDQTAFNLVMEKRRRLSEPSVVVVEEVEEVVEVVEVVVRATLLEKRWMVHLI